MSVCLGISFSGNSIFFSELNSENGSVKLNNTSSVKINFDFEDSFYRHKSSQKDLTNIAAEIMNYVSKRDTAIYDAALTLGTSQAFLLTLPIDYSEGKSSMNSKIYWELSNYFPDNYNEYVINTYRLNNTMPCRESDEFLIIAVHKHTLEFIKRIFKISGLNLKLIDVDHFSAEFALRSSYNNLLENRRVLLTGLKRGRVDYGFIDSRKYKGYMYSKYNSDIEFNLSLVKKLNSIFEKNIFINSIERIYLYGDEIYDSTIDALRKLDKAPVEIMNPFIGINAVESLLSNDNLRKDAYKYSASCGAALRCLKQI